MKPLQFFSWLAVANLAEQDPEIVKAMLLNVLKELPGCKRFGSLAEAIEDYLDDPYFSPSQLNSLLSRFSHFAPQLKARGDDLESTVKAMAAQLPEHELKSEKLLAFQEVLRGLKHATTQGQRQAMELELAKLESHFRTLWSDYQSIPLSPQEVTPEAIVGHSILEEAFGHWFSALHHASNSRLDKAWESAWEGNRLLTAVSCWTAEFRHSLNGGVR